MDVNRTFQHNGAWHNQGHKLASGEHSIRLAAKPQPRCPVCRTDVEASYLVCPVCTTTLKQPCVSCKAPLEPLWQACPYCATPVGATPVGAAADPVALDLDAALAAEAVAIPQRPRRRRAAAS